MCAVANVTAYMAYACTKYVTRSRKQLLVGMKSTMRCNTQQECWKERALLPCCFCLQSRALLYLFTLTHSVMEAMAAAEQAIEQATATTSMATAAKTAANTAIAESDAATAGHPAAAVASSNSSMDSSNAADSQAPASEAERESQINDHGARHAQHGHMDPLQEALQLQRASQTPLEDEEQEDDSQPLIAAPKGLLQVPLDQRPAKKYFDRSVTLLVSHFTPVLLRLHLQCVCMPTTHSLCR